MSALLWVSGLGIVVANIAAVIGGTRQGIEGMVTVDILCIIFTAAFVCGRILLRATPAARRSGRAAAEKTGDTALDAAALGLRATRRIRHSTKNLLQQVKDRAAEKD